VISQLRPLELSGDAMTDVVKDFRVKVTVRNNRLLSAIEAAGYATQAEFARAAGLTASEVNELVAMRQAPVGADGRFISSAKAVMEALGACPSDLWSDEQLTMTLRKNTGEFAVDASGVESLRLHHIETMTLPDPAAVFESDELSGVVAKVLATLTPREAWVIRCRFGFLRDKEARTRQQIAEWLGITLNRVREIEREALRKLRHPSRSKALLEALEDQ
jgi:DNA-binding CsgD family transcriptional regulator